MNDSDFYSKFGKRVTCDIDDCGKKITSRGWCRKHYDRYLKHGDPRTVLPSGKTPNKVTLEQVREIRRLYNNENYHGLSADLAKKYGVTRSSICAIIHNKVYKDVV